MLRETSQEKALRLAAVRPLEECAEIQARIRKAHLRTGHDPDGRPPRLERLVAHIREHLFEGTLSVEGACKAVGIGDGGVGGELRAYIGFTVDELIDKLRIDTAFPLVAETGFSMGDIAHLVGFRTYRTFTRTYKIWVGEPPRKTRKRYRGGTGEPPVDLPVDIPFNFGDFRALRRIGEGAATPNDLERLRRALSELYPDTFGDRGSDLPETVLGPPFDAEVLERFQAERVVWPVLADLSFAEQRRYVGQCRSWTSALFDLLHEKSREEGRRDRQRGIELAQLALDSLDGAEGRLGDRIHSMRAQGWAWLGNARRLALDFSAAEGALKKAEAMLHVREYRPEPFAAGIVHICKGTLRMFQRRHEEAIDWFDSALGFFKDARDISWQIQTLIQRSSALIYRERYEEVSATLGKAAALLADTDEFLSYTVLYSIANGLAKSGAYREAAAQLAALQKRYSDPERPIWRYQGIWLSAKIDHAIGELDSAERKYRLGLSGFATLGEPLYEALLSLDLAVLYSETRQLAKVVEISAEILPVFESIRLYDETVVSLSLFGAAIGEGNVSAAILKEVRTSLERDPLVAVVQKGSQGEP